MLDKAIVEFAFTLPPALKLNTGQGNFVFRLAMKDLLPSEIVKREDARYIRADRGLDAGRAGRDGTGRVGFIRVPEVPFRRRMSGKRSGRSWAPRTARRRARYATATHSVFGIGPFSVDTMDSASFLY